MKLNKSKLKIGIIGSNGFIGENLCQFFKNKKVNTIIFPSFKKNKKNWIKNVSIYIKKKKPDIIINCSSSQLFTDDEKSIKELINSNITSQSIFLKKASENKNFKGYISFGSKSEYNEHGDFKPLNFYGVTKYAVDYIFKFFSQEFNLTIVSLKLFDTYGVNDKRKKIINLLLNNYKQNRTLALTPGNQTLDFVHIRDICDLINLICKDILKKKIYGFNKFTVSSKKPIKLKNLVKILKQKLKKKLKAELGKKKYRHKELMKSSTKYYNYPNWKIKTNLVNELIKIFDKY